jgi:hypothetical protein
MHHTGLKRGTVQRPGRGSGDGRNLDVFFVQKAIQDTPSERPMCSTALQCQIDLFQLRPPSLITERSF